MKVTIKINVFTVQEMKKEQGKTGKTYSDCKKNSIDQRQMYVITVNWEEQAALLWHSP